MFFRHLFNYFKTAPQGSGTVNTMAEKKAFVLRINPEVLKDLERWAADEFRSTNGQIEYLLQKALQEHKKGKNKTDKDSL